MLEIITGLVKVDNIFTLGTHEGMMSNIIRVEIVNLSILAKL